MKHWQIPNWEEYQHYKKRKPPWIKLYLKLIRNYDFLKLSEAERWLVVGLWIIAAETDNRIPDDPDYIRSSLHLTRKPDLHRLARLGWIRSIDVLE